MLWMEILEQVNKEVDWYVINSNTKEQKLLAMLALITFFVNFNAEACNFFYWNLCLQQLACDSFYGS